MSIFLSVIAVIAIAQPEVPDSYSFNTYDDYSLEKRNIIRCINWILKEPLHEQKEVRDAMNAYCMTWLGGSPLVTVELHTELMPFMEANIDLMYVYTLSLCKSKLESPEISNTEAYYKATEDVLHMAKISKGLEKDQTLCDLKRRYKKGTLRSWIQNTLSTCCEQ